MAKRSLKFAMLAATALAATSVHASATNKDQPFAPPVEVAATAHVGDEAAATPSPLRNIGLAAAATAALAAFVRWVGAARLLGWLRAAGSGAKEVGRVAVEAPVKAAKAVGRAIMSPLRFAVLAIGLGVFALIGVSVFDLEWAAGLAVGAAMAAVAWVGAARTRRALARAGAGFKR